MKKISFALLALLLFSCASVSTPRTPLQAQSPEAATESAEKTAEEWMISLAAYALFACASPETIQQQEIPPSSTGFNAFVNNFIKYWLDEMQKRVDPGVREKRAEEYERIRNLFKNEGYNELDAEIMVRSIEIIGPSPAAFDGHKKIKRTFRKNGWGNPNMLLRVEPDKKQVEIRITFVLTFFPDGTNFHDEPVPTYSTPRVLKIMKKDVWCVVNDRV